MSERLADISARIDGIRQLGAVVNAMKGIAAARAHAAHMQVGVVDSYAATIADAMSRVLLPDQSTSKAEHGQADCRLGLLVFCAEQGFAGAFSERVLDSIASQHDPTTLFLIGTRGLSIAAARGIIPSWTAPLPSQTLGIPKLADRITTAIYDQVALGHIDQLDVVFTGLSSGRAMLIRQRLFPIDLSVLGPMSAQRPVTQLSADALLASLGEDYFNAHVCKAALHAFAAENQARLEAMTSAGQQIAGELETFEATLRRARQEAITSEIIELGTGARARGQT